MKIYCRSDFCPANHADQSSGKPDEVETNLTSIICIPYFSLVSHSPIYRYDFPMKYFLFKTHFLNSSFLSFINNYEEINFGYMYIRFLNKHDSTAKLTSEVFHRHTQRCQDFS